MNFKKYFNLKTTVKNQHYFINIASNDLGRKNKSNAKIIVSIVSNDFYHKLN